MTMMEKKRNYSISELASEFDVTTRSIRFYEDQGLLQPVRHGQKRIYSHQDRVRMKLILRGKRLGFSLVEIREIFALWDETPSGSERQLNLMLKLIHQKREALKQKLEDIVSMQFELESAEGRCRDALDELRMHK